MVKVSCRTNLDIKHYHEKWPDELPERPMVGDIIQSAMKWTRVDAEGTTEFQLELRVCCVTWKKKRVDMSGVVKWIMEVELHLPEHRFASINDFNKWYDKITR